MSQDNDYDVIIIGTGAGGGTLAAKLAPTGNRVLVLERGGRLPREKANWDAHEVFVGKRYEADETWLDKDEKEFHPGIHYFVGGNTKVYGAALMRLRERDFGEVRHAGGLSPAWPISYADLAPFYREAEAMYRVRGLRGADPLEPPETEPYPHPAIAHEPRIQQLHDDLERQGLRPFPLPLGVMRDEADPAKSKCVRCATCDGFPCLVRAKADAEIVGIDPALEHANVTLVTDALVTRLETDAGGREVTRVIAERGGKETSFRGAIVVAACGAINSAALLLRSANDRHPNGLANASGALGRHYMCHNNSAVIALSLERNDTTFQKTLGLNDFYYEHEGSDVPLGHIQMLGKSDADMLASHAPVPAPHKVLKLMATHALDFWVASEDLPLWDNRVRLRPDGQIQLCYTPNNLEAHDRLKATLLGLLKHLGCEGSALPATVPLSTKIPLAATAHQVGTARFGTNPATSILDVNCKAHGLDNLYVVDGSFFPSISAVNPALTIAANAIRVAGRLQAQLGSGAATAAPDRAKNATRESESAIHIALCQPGP